jgi:hypothetical protein
LNRIVGFLLAVSAVLVLTSCGGGGGGGGSSLGRLSVIADFQDPTRTVPGYADTLRVNVTPPA